MLVTQAFTSGSYWPLYINLITTYTLWANYRWALLLTTWNREIYQRGQDVLVTRKGLQLAEIRSNTVKHPQSRHGTPLQGRMVGSQEMEGLLPAQELRKVSWRKWQARCVKKEDDG